MTKKFLFLSIIMSFCVFVGFSSCENFMNGSEVKSEIEKLIQHETADYCKIEIQANTLAVNKIVPLATTYDKDYKPTDHIDLSFEPSAAYQFRYWDARPAASVKFDDFKSLSTTATIMDDNDGDSIIIEPICVLRPEPALAVPNDPINPKNSSITISFLYPMNISEDYLKDIKIEIAGEDITEYFETPVLDRSNYDIVIAAKPDKILEFTSGTKTVKVTVPAKFYYTLTDGTKVHMSDDKTLEYKINQETIEKVSLNFVKGKYGDFENATNLEKNILESQVVNFIMDDNCFFSGWDFTYGDNNKAFTKENVKDADGDVLYTLIKDGSKSILKMTLPSDSDAKILEASNMYKMTLEVLSAFDSKINIKPIVYERPSVSISPSASETVAKNTPISILFTKEMSNIDDMVNLIKIEVDGASVTENFEAPIVSDDKKAITFNADLSKLIDTQSTTKTVTVTIPKEFSYTEGTTEIMLEEDVVFTYKISSATSVKGDFNFSNGSAGKTKINYSSSRSYNIGDTFTVRVTSEDSAYQFNGWYIATDSGTLPAECLNIVEDSENKEVTITVLRQITGVDVYPIYYKRPIIEDFKPVTSGVNTVCKDSQIIITFASEIDEEYLEQIRITKSGEDITSCFMAPFLSDDKTMVTFDPNYDNLMSVNGSSESVVVSVPEDLSYTTEDGVVVTANSTQSKTYRVKSETNKKLHISFGNYSNGGGTMNYGAAVDVSMGESITVIYSPTSGYSFTGWVIDASLAEVEYDSELLFSSSITLTAKDEGEINISGGAILYPEITDYEPKYNVNGVECDSTVTVFFNTLMDHATLIKDNISIRNRKTSADLSSYFTLIPSDINNITVLTFKVDESITELFESNVLSTYDIEITFNQDAVMSNDSETKLTGLKNEWYYRINSGTETVDPHFVEVHLYKTMNDDGTFEDELSETPFSMDFGWDDIDIYRQNHVRSLWAEFICYDKDSGVDHIYIEEDLKKTVAAIDAEVEVVSREIADKDSFEVMYDETGNVKKDKDGNILYRYIYEFKFDNSLDDGLTELKFTLFDRAGNDSDSLCYYVIKDTSIAGNFIASKGYYDNTRDYNRPVVDNIDNLCLDFSPDYYDHVNIDYYYGEYSEPLNIEKVEWGYTLGNMTEVERDSRYDSEWEKENIYYISKRADSSAYVKITASDTVGNEFARLVAIPESGKLLAYELKDRSDTVIQQDFYLKNFSEGIAVSYEKKFTISFIVGDDGELSWGSMSEWSANYNGTTTMHNFEYINRADPLPRYYQFAFSYDFDNWSIFGTNSTTYDLENFEPVNDSADDFIPQQIASVVASGLIPNTVTVDLEVEFDEESYTYDEEKHYCIGYKTYNDDVLSEMYLFSNSTSLSLASEKKYQLVPFVENSDGTHTARPDAIPYELDLTTPEYDTCPPVFPIYDVQSPMSDASYAPNFVDILSPTDNSGLLVDEDGIASLEYWFISNGDLGAVITDRSEAYLYQFKPKILKYDISEPKERLRFDLDDLPEGSYTLFVKVTDNSPQHNYKIQSYYVKNYTLDGSIKPYFGFVSEFENYEGKIEEAYTFDLRNNPEELGWVLKTTAQAFTENGWVNVFGRDDIPYGGVSPSYATLAIYGTKSNTYEYINEHDYSEPTHLSDYNFYLYKYAEEGCFVRIFSSETRYLGPGMNYYSVPYYVYPKYYKENIKCKSKNFMSIGNGLEVFADAPVLVHTFYCSSNLGDNVYSWLSHGIETGIVQEECGFTYDQSNLSDVPEHKYYTTIMHFADGTTLMTTPTIR